MTVATTRTEIKLKIDQFPDESIAMLAQFIEVLEAQLASSTVAKESRPALTHAEWLQFLEDTYGCLRDDPIERGDQGKYEVREAFV